MCLVDKRRLISMGLSVEAEANYLVLNGVETNTFELGQRHSKREYFLSVVSFVDIGFQVVERVAAWWCWRNRRHFILCVIERWYRIRNCAEFEEERGLGGEKQSKSRVFRPWVCLAPWSNVVAGAETVSKRTLFSYTMIAWDEGVISCEAEFLFNYVYGDIIDTSTYLSPSFILTILLNLSLHTGKGKLTKWHGMFWAFINGFLSIRAVKYKIPVERGRLLWQIGKSMSFFRKEISISVFFDHQMFQTSLTNSLM